MSKTIPTKLSFSTDLLRYAIVTKLVVSLLGSNNITEITPGITCKYNAKGLLIVIKTSNRYAVLTLKTEILLLEDQISQELKSKLLLEEGQEITLKAVLE